VLVDNATNTLARVGKHSPESIEGLKEAEQLLRRELVMLMRVQAAGGGYSEYLAASYNSLGAAMKHLLKFREAEAMYRKSLQIREGFLGPDHVEVGNSLSNLANLLCEVSEGQNPNW
jgi:hypothetical protein